MILSQREEKDNAQVSRTEAAKPGGQARLGKRWLS